MTSEQNRRWFLWYSAATLTSTVLLKACATNSPAPSSSPTVEQSPVGTPPKLPAAKDLKVAIVLPGVITDKAWNQAGYEGLSVIKSKLGLETAYVEKVGQANQAEVLSDFARRGFNLVYAHGGQFDAAIEQVAPQFPNTFFIGVNGATSGSNRVSLRIDHLQISYLCGMIAATLSQTKKLAYLAGQEFQATQEELRGFQLGAQSVDPQIEVKSTFTGDWNDVARAKEALLALISTGADVIYPWMDNAAPTVLQTCAEKGVFTFGNTVDQLALAPTAVLTSAVKRMDLAIAKLADLATRKQLEGKIYNFGLEELEILYLGKYSTAVPADLQAKIKQTQAAILAKTLSFEPCMDAGKATRCVKTG